MERAPTADTGKIALSEGAEVYGSDGERWGRVEEVGARYLKVAEGLLGAKAWYVPAALVACGDADRVELTVPLSASCSELSACVERRSQWRRKGHFRSQTKGVGVEEG
jgi:hypothetical protein